jgi:hypothetical protein
MKKILIILVLLFQYNLYSKIIGSKLAGIPFVQISNLELMSQLSSLQLSGFTNIQIISKDIVQTQNNNAYFRITYSYIPPMDSVIYKSNLYYYCDYNEVENSYTINLTSDYFACHSTNCSSGCVKNGEGCTACVTEDPTKTSKCSRDLILSTFPWKTEYMQFLTNFENWLKS